MEEGEEEENKKYFLLGVAVLRQAGSLLVNQSREGFICLQW